MSDKARSSAARRQAAILKLLRNGTAEKLVLADDDQARLVTPAGISLMALPGTLARDMAKNDLVAPSGLSEYRLTKAGIAWLARHDAPTLGFRAQHGHVVRQTIDDGEGGATRIWRDEAESPLAWLRARRGKDGARLLDDAQYGAGERLRLDTTRAQLLPRTTANWDASVADGRRGAGGSEFADATVAARQRVRRAVDAVGPELSGILLDVCCFLKPMEQIERERGWPARSGRIVLGLALTRLAGHYGLRSEAVGPAEGHMTSWRSAGSK